MKNLLSQFWNNEDGVTAIEYAMIGVAMAAILAVAMGTSDDKGLRSVIKGAFGKISSSISSMNGKVSGA